MPFFCGFRFGVRRVCGPHFEEYGLDKLVKHIILYGPMELKDFVGFMNQYRDIHMLHNPGKMNDVITKDPIYLVVSDDLIIGQPINNLGDFNRIKDTIEKNQQEILMVLRNICDMTYHKFSQISVVEFTQKLAH
jgi:hypothetical protein